MKRAGIWYKIELYCDEDSSTHYIPGGAGMTKETFLNELRNRLSGLPKEDLEDRITFYREMIEERVADGASEEEAVAAMEPVERIAEKFMAEIPLTKLVRERVKPGRTLKTWEIILIILGFPVWFPLVIAAAAVSFSLYLVLWALALCVCAVDFSMAAGAFAGLLGLLANLGQMSLPGAGFIAGCIMILAGLSIIMFFVCTWVTKGILRMTGGMLLGLKVLFVGKGTRN